jgi:hypothetical protein
MAQQFVIPGGKERGRSLSEASDSALDYWATRVGADVEANPEKPYADRDRALLDAMVEEQTRRASGGGTAPLSPAAPATTKQQSPPRQAAKPQAALATRPADSVIAGSLTNAAEVTARLASASQQYHLVSPATSCGMLPEGCAVAISLVHVDPNPSQDGPKEVYSVSGRLAPSLVTLQRIASAAGISWVPEQCGRLDNGRDPHYCHFRAVGKVRMFDSSARTLTGEVEIDMREGSPQLEGMTTKAIEQTRKFILRHAESKAKNRAVADMGVKRSYAPEELAKPFAVARLMWTGETSDPELRKEAFRMRAEAMGGATRALYPPQTRPVLPAFQGHGAPPAGSVTDDPGDIGTHDVDTDYAPY